jgi:hypothetical protein
MSFISYTIKSNIFAAPPKQINYDNELGGKQKILNIISNLLFEILECVNQLSAQLLLVDYYILETGKT